MELLLLGAGSLVAGNRRRFIARVFGCELELRNGRIIIGSTNSQKRSLRQVT